MRAVTNPKSRKRQPKAALIYLVDDEALLLELAEVALLPQGHRIRKFQDPAKALKALQKARNKPDLLVTDYAMGDMNGMELIERCKQIHPSIKSVLVSGTAGAEIIVNAPVHIDRFVGKPYQPVGLANLVRHLLNSDHPPSPGVAT